MVLCILQKRTLRCREINQRVQYYIVSCRVRIKIQVLWLWASQAAQTVKNPPANAGDLGSRPGFNPWVRMTPQSRKWQPTPVFFPGESHGERSLVATVHRVAKYRKQLSMQSSVHDNLCYSSYTTMKGKLIDKCKQHSQTDKTNHIDLLL